MISRKNVADSHILDLAADGFGLRAMEGRGPRTCDGDNPPGHARRRPAGSSSDPCAVRERRYRPSGSRPDCGTFDLHVGDDSTSLLADGGSCPADFATSGALQPAGGRGDASDCLFRSEEHTSELQSLMRISYAVFCLKKKKNNI